MASPAVLLIGGGGFVGRSLANELVRRGRDVIISSRNQLPPRTLPAGVRWETCNVHSPEELKALLDRCNPLEAVFNLVGVLHDRPAQPYGEEFRLAHVSLPCRLVELLQNQGPHRFIHVSSLGADSRAPSMYLRSKGDGELCVRQSRLEWTLFRPSVIFGREDNFINLFGRLSRWLPLIPLAGATARLQPVSVNDVAHALAASLDMPETIRKAFDLAGPSVYTLADLVRFSGEKVGRSRLIVPLPPLLGQAQAALMECLPGTPLMSRDNLASLNQDSVLPEGTVNPLLAVFRRTPEALESLLT